MADAATKKVPAWLTNKRTWIMMGFVIIILMVTHSFFSPRARAADTHDDAATGGGNQNFPRRVELTPVSNEESRPRRDCFTNYYTIGSDWTVIKCPPGYTHVVHPGTAPIVAVTGRTGGIQTSDIVGDMHQEDDDKIVLCLKPGYVNSKGLAQAVVKIVFIQNITPEERILASMR